MADGYAQRPKVVLREELGFISLDITLDGDKKGRRSNNLTHLGFACR